MPDKISVDPVDYIRLRWSSGKLDGQDISLICNHIQELQKVAKEAGALEELVEDAAKAQTVDEAWAASEKCYDFMHKKRNPDLYKETKDV